jgi:hypothetical protein
MGRSIIPGLEAVLEVAGDAEFLEGDGVVHGAGHFVLIDDIELDESLEEEEVVGLAGAEPEVAPEVEGQDAALLEEEALDQQMRVLLVVVAGQGGTRSGSSGWSPCDWLVSTRQSGQPGTASWSGTGLLLVRLPLAGHQGTRWSPRHVLVTLALALQVQLPHLLRDGPDLYRQGFQVLALQDHFCLYWRLV